MHNRIVATVHFAATVFVSALLLFLVQPLIGNAILPWFGGSPAVWNTAMLFFQFVLLGGYCYAHLIDKHLSPRAMAVTHIGLLAVALLTLPIAPSDWWKPRTSDQPTRQILLLLSACVG